MKHLRLLLCVSLLAAVASSARAGDVERVTEQVHGFYQWYFHMLNTTPGDDESKHRKEFKRYVTAKLLYHVAHMSEGEGQEGDPYFLQPDFDPAWEKNIAISHVKVDAKGKATAEMHLTGHEMPGKLFKITLMLEDGNYKIAKVDLIRDDPPEKPAATPTPSATP